MNLERLIDDWRGPLIGLLASWGLGWDAAREVAQDTFAEAYLGRERFRGSLEDPDQVGGWLVGIARNLHRSRARSEARHRADEFGDRAGLDEPASEATGEGDDERAQLVRRAVDGLSEEHRQVIYVCYFEEQPVRQAAALLGISEKAVEGRLYRARGELRRRLRTLDTTSRSPQAPSQTPSQTREVQG